MGFSDRGTGKGGFSAGIFGLAQAQQIHGRRLSPECKALPCVHFDPLSPCIDYASSLAFTVGSL